MEVIVPAVLSQCQRAHDSASRRPVRDARGERESGLLCSSMQSLEHNVRHGFPRCPLLHVQHVRNFIGIHARVLQL